MPSVDVNSNTSADIDTEGASKSMNDTVQQGAQKVNQSMNDVKNQLVQYGNQIQSLLNNVQANVEGYKFSVESTENGLTIDAMFKATIQQKRA